MLSLSNNDTAAFCFSREVYLKKNLEIPNSEGWVALNDSKEIMGYAVAIQAQEKYGWLVIPFIADNASVAEALLVRISKIVLDQPNKTLSMNIPGVNKGAMELAQRFCGSVNFKIRRMFSMDPPQVIVENHKNKIYSINFCVG